MQNIVLTAETITLTQFLALSFLSQSSLQVLLGHLSLSRYKEMLNLSIERETNKARTFRTWLYTLHCSDEGATLRHGFPTSSLLFSLLISLPLSFPLSPPFHFFLFISLSYSILGLYLMVLTVISDYVLGSDPWQCCRDNMRCLTFEKALLHVRQVP